MPSGPGGLRLFANLVTSFISSEQFQKLADNSKQLWERELKEAAKLDNLGIFSTREIMPALVQQYLDGLSGRPGKQAAALTALKALNRWARVRNFLPQSIVDGVRTERPEGGHLPWTQAQVTKAEREARPDLARAITLAGSTGQRVGDLVRMAWTDIEKHRGHEGINVCQQKTGRELWVPIDDHLASALDSWGRRDVGPILLNRKGEPWSSAVHLRMAWDHEKKINTALAEHRKEKLVMHGLRGYRCVSLSRRGLTDHQVGDVVGMSVKMVERYTRLSSQKENAFAALFGGSK